MAEARRAAELAARASYGRLLSILAARSRDIAASEDALSEAFAAALKDWPQRGVPANPDAWLLTAARNRMRNSFRHQAVTANAAAEMERAFAERMDDVDPDFPDHRLMLLFVCAHPAIDESVRTPLMLQTVLGLDAARIGSAFLTAPATIGQRLVRAKAKIKEAGIRFVVPGPSDLPERIPDVLNAIYAAYGTGWDAIAGANSDGKDLAEEAIFLGRLVVSLLPKEPEAKGLLALMLHCEARRDARRDPDGRFVPLFRQDARLWKRDFIIEAEGLITLAAQSGQFGRFLCEAAIQSVHAQRPITGQTNYAALRTLYQLLAREAPSIGVFVAEAAMLAEAGAPEEALQRLDALGEDSIRTYQPYWVARAHALQLLHRTADARLSYERAIGLTTDQGLRDYLSALMAR